MGGCLVVLEGFFDLDCGCCYGKEKGIHPYVQQLGKIKFVDLGYHSGHLYNAHSPAGTVVFDPCRHLGLKLHYPVFQDVYDPIST